MKPIDNARSRGFDRMRLNCSTFEVDGKHKRLPRRFGTSLNESHGLKPLRRVTGEHKN